MGLYKLFSYNVQVQYKSCLLSKAMLFTIITTLLNIIIPFIIAYKSRGFWLRSQYFYEQPVTSFNYEYLLKVETDVPGRPIVCGETNGYYGNALRQEENCVEFQVDEHDYDSDGKNDLLVFNMYLNVPQQRKLTSLIFILMLDFQLKNVCPLQMQSLAVIHKEFSVPPSEFKYYGDLEFYQTTHLPCKRNIIDARYNISIFEYMKNNNDQLLDSVLKGYFLREVTTHTKTIYSRSHNGPTDSMVLDINIRIPEMEVRYAPSVMEELKWAWPQYLSLALVIYWLLKKIKVFVFSNRLLMAWEIVPWKKYT